MKEIDGAVYALRNRIERCFNHLKNALVAIAYDNKLVEKFSGFVHLMARSYRQHLPAGVIFSRNAASSTFSAEL